VPENGGADSLVTPDQGKDGVLHYVDNSLFIYYFLFPTNNNYGEWATIQVQADIKR